MRGCIVSPGGGGRAFSQGEGAEVRRSGLVAYLLWKMGNQRPHGCAHGSFRSRPMTGSSTSWLICPWAWYKTRPYGQTPSAPTGVSGGPQVRWGWSSRDPGQADSCRHSGNSPQGGRGSGWGTRVCPWWIHVDVWQNQYNIVK